MEESQVPVSLPGPTDLCDPTKPRLSVTNHSAQRADYRPPSKSLKVPGNGYPNLLANGHRNQID